MTDRPIVVRYPDGREYGVEDAETAKRVHPDAAIVRYQDGEIIEQSKPKAGKPKDGEA